MSQQRYVHCFTSHDVADAWMRAKNRHARQGDIFCLVDGPDDNFAVVDLETAIDLGGTYTWGR